MLKADEAQLDIAMAKRSRIFKERGQKSHQPNADLNSQLDNKKNKEKFQPKKYVTVATDESMERVLPERSKRIPIH